jgi:hypothetical protein
MNEVNIKKFKDPYLKPIILDAVKKIEEFAWFRKKGDQSVYYEGHFQEDVLNNFSKRESDEIFNRMRRYLNDNILLFLQKKVKVKYKKILDTGLSVDDSQYHYEYIVSKR